MPPLPTSNCGLTRATIGAAGGPPRRVEATGPRTSDERDERDVDDGEVDGLAEGLAGQVPGVRPVVDDDPRVAGDRVRQLTPPDVDGVDAGRAALEQDVGEAAGRRAGVEADEPRRVDAERVERGGELVAAAADVRVALHDRDRDVRLDEVAGLPVEPPGIARPDADLARP